MEFLKARRELLARAANEFLGDILGGAIPETPAPAALGEVPAAGVGPEEEEEQILAEVNDWVMAQGLPSGEFDYEILDPGTGEPVALLDLAWPDGLQEGLSKPVALLLNEGEETEEAASQAGFEFYTSPETFRRYVETKILAMAEE